VEETVAREEAKAFLKASEARTGRNCSGEVVPPTDVLGKRPDRPVHDISISPFSPFACTNDAPVALLCILLLLTGLPSRDGERKP